MGNCQAAEAEAETVVIMHPDNKIERRYWSVTVRRVMNSHPGHYAAVVVTEKGAENGLPVKKLKLLRPDDLLVVGNVYRLICFQDILKEFTAKKCVKLGKLLKERGVCWYFEPNSRSQSHMMQHSGNSSNRSRNRSRVRGRKHHKHQWKPELMSISEYEN